MSYQIKSTPFFRRMVTTSKRNGQLQKLKEEYERIKEFNERTIEMKMRQVRLRRLFREIEEIKETTMNGHQKRRRILHDRSKTSDELRKETVIKSRELGKEFSKLNAVMSERGVANVGGGCVNRNDINYNISNSINAKGNRNVDRKALAAMRISYGNDISRNNIQKLAQSNSRRKIPPIESAAKVKAETERSKKETLQKRLSYGNSRSSANLSRIPKKPQKQRAHLNSISNISPQIENSRILTRSSTDNCQLNVDNSNAANMETFNTISDLLNIPPKVYDIQMDERQLRRKQALNSWNNLKLVIRAVNAFNNKPVNERNFVIGAQIFSVHDLLPENNLHTISNETCITQEELFLHKEYISSFIKNKDNDDDGLSNEVVMNVEELNVPSCPNEFVNAVPEEIDYVETRMLPPVPSHEQVQRYVELFEPIVREAAQEKAIEMGVQKLREIFEHTN